MNPRPLGQEPTILQQLLFFPDKDEVPSDGRIRFKKPTGSKRDKSGNDDLPESEESKEKKKKKKDKKAEKNLLSFQDEEDDEWAVLIQYRWQSLNDSSLVEYRGRNESLAS